MTHNFIKKDGEQVVKNVKETPDPVKQLKDFKSTNAKKYFCWNLFGNKLAIGLWHIPEMSYYNFPVFNFFKCSSYNKFGIRKKRLLFEIVWNKQLKYTHILHKKYSTNR